MSDLIAGLVDWLNVSSPGLLLGIIELSLRAFLLLAGAWVVALFLRRSPAAQRHALWSVAITIAVLLPLFSAFVPALHLPLPLIANIFPAETVETAIEVVGETRIRMLPFGPVHQSAPAASPLSWQSVTLLIWAVGTSLVILWLLAGRIRAWLLIRRAAPLPQGRLSKLAREVAREYSLSAPRILLSAETDVPMVVGALRPVLLVPKRAEGWSDFQLRTMLLHELAHVQRRDMLAHLPSFAALALHWLNPLAWLATRKQVFERELAADEAVLSSGIRPSEYAEHLLSAAGRANGLRFAPGTTAGMARGTDFKRRVRHILGSDPTPKNTKRSNVTMTILAIILISLPIAGWQPWTTVDPEAAQQGPVGVPLTERMATVPMTEENNSPTTNQEPEPAEKSETEPAKKEQAPDTQKPKPQPNPPAEKNSTETLVENSSDELTTAPQDRPLEVAGNIKPPEVRFHGPQPFPDKAKILRRPGQVKVRLIIWLDGSFEVVRIEKENPPELGFGDAIKQYLEQSTWEPATLDGEPISVYFDLTVNFTLSDSNQLSHPGRALMESADEIITITGGKSPAANNVLQDNRDRYRSKDGIYDAGPGGLPEPELLKRVEPEYPEHARKLKVNGFVLVEAVVDEHGLVESVKILQSPAKRYGFAKAARDAVSQWEFEPTTINAKPVKVRIRFSVEFQLVDDSQSKNLPSLPPGMEDEEEFEPPTARFNRGIKPLPEPDFRYIGRKPFPRKALNLKRDGEATARLSIRADGSWELLEILNVAPASYRFDEAMRLYLERARWEPATYKGKPIDYVYDYTVKFDVSNTIYGIRGPHSRNGRTRDFNK